MADTHRDRGTQRKRNHEHGRREVDRNLVRRGHGRTARPHEYRHRIEKARFRRDRDGNRHPQHDDFLQHGGAKAPDARENFQRRIVPARHHVDHEHKHQGPHRYSTCNPAADRAKRWRTEVAEHEYVVQEHVAEQRKDRGVHDRPGTPDSLRREPQRQEYENRRAAPDNGFDVSEREVPEAFVDADLQEQWLDRGICQHDQRRTDPESKVHPLPGISTYEFRVAGSVMARRYRRDRHEHAKAKREPEKPDAGADRDSGERLGAEPAGHDGIGKLHARNGEVVDNQRAGKLEQLPDLLAPVARPPHAANVTYFHGKLRAQRELYA